MTTPDMSAAAVTVRLQRTAQLRRLCLELGAHAREARWQFAIGQLVVVAAEASAVLGPGRHGRVVGRQLRHEPTYLLELDDRRTVEVAEAQIRKVDVRPTP